MKTAYWRWLTRGKTPVDMARHFGVSRQAVHKRLADIRSRNTKVVISRKMVAAVDRKLDSISQLHEINRKTLALLDEAEGNPNLALRCIAEVRNQLKLSLEIFETMYSLQAVEEFQRIVKEVIKEAAPDVYKEILRRLNNEVAVTRALQLT